MMMFEKWNKIKSNLKVDLQINEIMKYFQHQTNVYHPLSTTKAIKSHPLPIIFCPINSNFINGRPNFRLYLLR